MRQRAFNFSEFINPEMDEVTLDDSIDENVETDEAVEEAVEEEQEGESAEELDVQKAVVEELATEAVELKEKLANNEAEFIALKTKYEQAMREIDIKNAEIFSVKAELDKAMTSANALSLKLAAQISKEEDLQERNPNALALLDREVELPDRFPGETRDHVLEVVREARDRAEAEGRIRRAQILESVLVANEPNGTLARKRAELEKLFNDNSNILSGQVIEELESIGISHKNGEEYLLPSEIIKRTY